jgi:amino acid adenylation domain-containing protein/FkbH-like protein
VSKEVSQNETLPAEEVSRNGGRSPADALSTKAAVARAWIEVLRIENIGQTDNFFDLGGDSLKAMEVISRLQASLNIELPLIAFFEDPTIAHLTAAAEELRRAATDASSRSATKAAVEHAWIEVLRIEKIGDTDNFFDLGGDSLKAMEVISRLQASLNIELPLIAFFEDPTITHLTDAAEELCQAGGQASGGSTATGKAPLSFGQLMFWLLQQRDSLGHLHNQQRVLRIRGSFYSDVLQRSLDEICRRHQVLRTRYEPGVDEPVQVMDPHSRVELQFQDLRSLPAENREETALGIAREECHRPFNLSTELPLRARLLQLADDDHVLVVVMHHTVTDGRTSGIFFDDLSAIYDATLAGRTHTLPELAFQYADYAKRERAEMQGSRLEEEVAYWRSHLQGAPPTLNLPTDRVRPQQASHAGERRRLMLTDATVERLKETARATGSTLFTVILGALRILLYRWTAQQDIVIGTVASNRSRSGSERMVGCFLNFLPLRNTVSSDERALDVLNREKQLVMDGFAHQECPFLKIVAGTGASQTADSINPIYNVALLLQNYEEMKFAGKSFTAEFVDWNTETAQLDLRFVAAERRGGLQLDCEFNTELFNGESAQNLLDGFAGVLESLAADAERRVSDFVIPRQLAEQSDAAQRREQKQTIAIASTFTAETVEASLVFWMKKLGVRAEFAFAPYNQVFQQLLDPSSLISRNSDGVNIVLLRLSDWQRFAESATPAEARQKIESNLRELAGALRTVAQRSSAPILVCTCPPERRLTADPEWVGFLDRMEKTLVSELSATPGLHLITSSQTLELYPVDNYEDEYADKLGHIPYTPDFFTAIGTMLARRMFSLRSAPRKVIVLDCDNTLWKGVCGEEGPTGVSVDNPRHALQQFMLKQIDAGMLLCLCSKNSAEDVDAVFAQNPGMLLRDRHIAARRVNWNAKSQNLRELADELQLGLDSFVFVDDNPIECAEVDAQCPEVLTLALPQDAEQIPGFLTGVWALDHWKVTTEDAQRTEMYRQGAEREQLRKQASTLDEFLSGLDLKLAIRPAEDADLARVSQLTERTNQFNFTTVRRSELEIQQFLDNGGECLAVNLSDRFGDYGLVGVILYSAGESALAIDTMLLSCRALGRKVEHHMLSRLGEIARQRKLGRVIAKFIPTRKNQPALDFLDSIGSHFRQPVDGHFVYDFPADDAADVHRKEVRSEAAESPEARPKGAAMNPQIADQNQRLRDIAKDLRDVSGISRAMELERASHRQRRDVLVAPRTPIEEVVAGTWSQLLNVDRVGIHDNFFALGGHSLLAAQVVARVRQTLGVELPLRALFEAPTIAELALRIDSARRTGAGAPIPAIAKLVNRDHVPVSFAQQRLWFLDQLEPGNPLYNIPQMFHLLGRLDTVSLHRALNQIVERHESLRTTFEVRGGEPVQVIARSLELQLSILDLSSIPARELDLQAQKLAREEARRPFELSAGPLLRAQLLRLAPEDHLLLLTMHHIISDRWSMGVLSEELTAHYAAFVEQRPAPFPDLAIQYTDFAVWQRHWLQEGVLADQLEYWKKQLTGAPPILELPTDRTRPPVMSLAGESVAIVLPGSLVEKLNVLSQAEGVTLFMTLLAAFQTLLTRYSGQEDIVVGSPVANRSVAEIEPLIGFFVNTLAFRGDLSGDPSFRELMARVKEVCLQAYAHQDIPFEKLVEELRPQRSLAHSPIFQVMFALQNAPLRVPELPGLSLQRVPMYTGTSMFDMSWFAIEVPEGIMVRAEYSTDIFDEITVRRALGHFQRLLEAVVANPAARLSALPLLVEEERCKILVAPNETQADYPRELCAHQLFEQRVAESPDSIAAVMGTDRLTYHELNARANQLANYLRNNGVGPDVLVGIHVERSLHMLVALLAVLKAGGAYVPLDPLFPKDRIAFILEDANATLLLTQSSLIDSLPKNSATTICLDTDWNLVTKESSDNLPPAADAGNLAYVLFTSGSTGKPKGVQIEHRSLTNFLCSMQRIPGISRKDVLLAVTTLSFDIAGLELYLPLVSGACVVIASHDEARDGHSLIPMIAMHRVTMMQATPITWRLMLQAGWEGSEKLKVLCGGEAFPRELADQLVPRCMELWNMYGPTETTIWSSLHRVEAGETGPVAIGRAIANTELYVLDANRQPVPMGVPGELYIGGDGLARGYLNRPELTLEKFVAHPFRSSPRGRLYRTGDLVRYRQDGSIVFMNRLDTQVKIRGFRIELGEIEAVLAKHSGVRESVVLAREDETGMPRLVAYVVPNDHTHTGEDALRDHLKQVLPEYMIPSAFVAMDSFPLTPNGKINRKALPAPESKAPEGDEYFAPGTPVEERVAAVWAEVLRLERISTNSDFFALGGHSLLATQIISRLRQAFAIELPLRTIFESPTVSALAARIQRAKRGFELPPITRVAREKPVPASFAQQRLWFLDELQPDSSLFNIASTAKIDGALDDVAIESSLNAIASRHESLRTAFGSVADQAVQIIQDSVVVPLLRIDLSQTPEPGRAEEARRLIAKQANLPFDLAKAPLLRAVLIRLSPQEHYLSINIHHIISDRWSLGVLWQELGSFYQAATQGSRSELPALPLQYADYAAWQHEWLRGEVLEKQLAFWKEQLHGAPPVLELPTDRPRPAYESSRGDVAEIRFSKQLTEQLQHLSRSHGATLFMTLLAAFQALLSRYSGQDDIVVGTAIANRTQPELEHVLGLFLNTLPLRTRLSGDPTFSEIMGRAKATALEAYAHQEMPFEKLVETLRPERSLSHSPLVQVYFILQNAPMELPRIAGLALNSVSSGLKAVKGDMFLSMMESPEGLQARLEYSTDLFNASTMERFLDHYRVLLEAVSANPAIKLSHLPLLTDGEFKEILLDWNATSTDYPRDFCLHELFELQAARSPEAVALFQPGGIDSNSEDREITYLELNRRANQLAHALRRRGAGPGQRIGIFLERSIEMMVGLIGIQKSGAAYVPLDPAYPAERIRLTLEDAAVPVVITQDALLPKLPRRDEVILCVDRDAPDIAKESTANPGKTARPEDLMYVIFTSGSTGRPKGVQVPHRAVVNLLTFMANELHMGPADVFPALASFAFDMCIPELYLALISGGRVVIGRKDLSANGEDLAAVLRNTGATIVHATPTTWSLLLEAGFSGKGLKRVIGAEPMPRELCRRLLAADASLYNFYGPTETTVWSTFHHFRSPDEPVVVGKPLANTQVYILDQNQQPVPIGVSGEIYIGGEGVAHGYLNRPELTAEKFVRDSFSRWPDAKMYRTGDLGRFIADGRIEFQARADHQVKIRGYRVELGEIEAVIGRHPAVGQDVVAVREDVAGDKRLVAYIVAKEGQSIDAANLRNWVRDQLPDYMVPVAWVGMDKLPLSPNGKVDRKRLPAPEYLRPELEDKYVSPRSPEEQVIASVWADVLKIDRVGVEDDFFELGGHSLLATQVVSRIRQAFKITLPLRDLFEAPTVGMLAGRARAAIKQQLGLQAPPLRRVSRNQPLPLSFPQQRLWFLDQLEPGNPIYNVAHVTRMRGPVNATAIIDMLNEIVRRHESLRTTFHMLNDEPVQVVAAALELKLSVADASHMPDAESRLAQARQMAMQEIRTPFDLTTGPLLRPLLIKIDDNDHALILNTHHIISDRWSLGVLSQELAALYEARLEGKSSPLPELEIQYADYAVWQREFFSGDILEKQMNYWRQQLEGARPVLRLPTDRPSQDGEPFWGASHHQALPTEVARDLRALARRHHGTFFMALLASFEMLMSKLSGQDDLVIGTDLANRNQLETEKLIGFFVNLLPIRARLDRNTAFADFFADVRETCLQAMAHQDIPFDKLVEELRPERSLTRNPLVQVLFVMQNTPQPVRQFGGMKLGPLGVSTSSRFDLVMFVNDPDGVPSISWVYNPNLFDASTIERFAAAYDFLLRAACADPDATLDSMFAQLEKAENERRSAEQQKHQEAGRDKLKKIRRKAIAEV